MLKKEVKETLGMNPHTPTSKDLGVQKSRQAIVEEVKKTERNLPLISKMIQTIFALR